MSKVCCVEILGRRASNGEGNWSRQVATLLVGVMDRLWVYTLALGFGPLLPQAWMLATQDFDCNCGSQWGESRRHFLGFQFVIAKAP